MIQQCGDGHNVEVADMLFQLTDAVHDYGVLPKEPEKPFGWVFWWFWDTV